MDEVIVLEGYNANNNTFGGFKMPKSLLGLKLPSDIQDSVASGALVAGGIMANRVIVANLGRQLGFNNQQQALLRLATGLALGAVALKVTNKKNASAIMNGAVADAVTNAIAVFVPSVNIALSGAGRDLGLIATEENSDIRQLPIRTPALNGGRNGLGLQAIETPFPFNIM